MAQRPKAGESAADIYPELLLDWDNNNDGTLYDYKPGSNAVVHWICHRCQTDSYRSIYSATKYKCKKCSIIDRSKNKDKAGLTLTEAFPEIASQWNFSKNTIDIKNVTQCSDKKVWWICSFGHEWEQTVANRTHNNSGCPICANTTRGQKIKIADDTNSLQSRFPNIAMEIDRNKNDVDANKIKYGSHDILWWKCSRGHSYKCMVAERTLRNYGCKICSAHGTSLGEQVVFRYFKKVYKNVKNRDKHLGIELDVYIDDIEIAVEYNGFNWHKDKEDIDNFKAKTCNENGIKLYTIIEHPNTEQFKRIDEATFTVGGSNKNKTVEILKIVGIILKEYGVQLDKEKATSAIKEAYEYRRGKPEIGESFAEKRPDLLEEWDFNKNEANPFDLKCGSNYKAFWVCKKCGHSWSTIVYNRATLGNNCPECNKNKETV